MKIPTSLLKLIASVQRVTVLTGAGVSAESGVPTFRDSQTGLWSNFNWEELATSAGFLSNPRVVWAWYARRREIVARAKPNPAHLALAEMEGCVPHFTLITQNIDGLHCRAGSKNVIELHGNITRTKCFNDNTPVTDWPETEDVPPRCPNCGGLLRPDVVWFGEAMPEEETKRAFIDSTGCDIFLSIGTSAEVYPAAALPMHAQKSGATLVEINTDATSLATQADFVLIGKAGVILPKLLAAMSSHR